MNIRSLLTHAFMQGSSIPMFSQRMGQEYRPSFIRLLRHFAHAGIFMCAQGLVLAVRECGAMYAFFKRKNATKG